MDKETPISNGGRRPLTRESRVRGVSRAGFGVAPVLYLLGLIGVGAGVLFSSYSQSLKNNVQMINGFAVKSDLNSAATTLAATSVLGATNPGVLCPPQGGADGVGTNCVNAPTKMIEIGSVSTSDPHLPGGFNTFAALTSGVSPTPAEVGIFASGAGIKQLDPWGHYYIYCRWESSASSSNPAIVILSAGSTGVMNTTCGATTASSTPDNYLTSINAATAVNRAAVWQTGNLSLGSTSLGTSGVYYGATGAQLGVDNAGNLYVPGNITADGSYSSAAGNVSLTSGSVGAVNGVFSGYLSAESADFMTGSGGTLSAANGAFAVNSGGTVSAANGAFTVTSGGALNAANNGFTVDSSGDLAIGTSNFTVTESSGNVAAAGSVAVGSTIVTGGLVDIGTVLAASGSSTPIFTVGKKVSGFYPFYVDQYGAVAASSVSAGTFNGNLNGNMSGGTVNTTGLTASALTSITGSIGTWSTTGNIVDSGTIQATNFVGGISLGSSGGVTLTGVVPIANGGTNASTASQALINLGGNNASNLTTGTLAYTLLDTTGISNSGGPYNQVYVDAYGRVISAALVSTAGSYITDGAGDQITTGTSTGITFTVGSQTEGVWNATGLMVGTGSPTARDKLDVYGSEAIGTSYAGTVAAPTNGLIVVGSVGIGTSSPVSALQVVGTVTATTFSGSGSGLTGIGTGAITGTLGTANGGTGTSTAFTQGSVVFAGASGVYSQDNANFFWDDTHDRLGIGTGSPSAALDAVSCCGLLAHIAATNGSGGYLQFANLGNGKGGYIGQDVPGTSGNTNYGLWLAAYDGSTVSVGMKLNTLGTNQISFFTSSSMTEQMSITTYGNVGIGSTLPVASLDLSQKTDAIALPSGASSARPSSPVNGEIRYNTATPGVEAYVNNTWSTLISTGGTTGVLPTGNGGTGTSTTFTQGSVVFAGASGVYSQDNANFFWDDTHDRLGIGTATPTTTVQLGTSYSGSPQTLSFIGSGQTSGAPTGTISFDYDNSLYGFDIVNSNSGNLFSNVTGGLVFATRRNSSTQVPRFVISSGYNYVEIPNEGVTSTFVIAGGGSGNTAQLLLTSPDASNNNASILFSFGNTNPAPGTLSYMKGAIFYNDLAAGFGRGDLIFAQNSAADTTNATTANAAMIIKNSGLIGIGTATPTSLLHTYDNTAQTATYTGVLHDVFDTSTTASVNKVGMDIESTGAWTGTSAVNTGLVVNATGGTTNYAATFSGGNVGIGITNPSEPLQVVGTVEFGNMFLNTADAYGDRVLENGSLNLSVVAGSARIFLQNSTGYIGIGSTSPVTNLDLSQETGAIALPVGSSGTRPASSINGEIRYNSSTPGVEAYVNGAWQALLGGSGGVLGTGNGGTGTGTTFTQGSIVFAGASGVYSQDNANFYWNDSTDRLGIGTSSPQATFDVRGTAEFNYGGGGSHGNSGNTVIDIAGTYGTNLTAEFSQYSGTGSGAVNTYIASNASSYFNGGNVGIGTTSPVVSLDLSQKTDAIALPVGSSGTRPSTGVNGMIRYNTSTPGVEAYVNNAWSTLLSGGGSGITLGTTLTALNPQKSGDNTTGLYSDATGTVEVAAGGTKSLSISSSIISMPVGSVGIGTASSSSTLTVNGNSYFGNGTGSQQFDFVTRGDYDAFRLYSLNNSSGGSVNPPSIGFYRSTTAPAASPRFRISGTNPGGADYDGFYLSSPNSSIGWLGGDTNYGNSNGTANWLVADTQDAMYSYQEFYVAEGELVVGRDTGASSNAIGGTVRSGQKNSAGTNAGGSNLIIEAGGGTGSGTPGDLLFDTASMLGAGTSIQTYTQRMVVKNTTGNVGIGTGSPGSLLTSYDNAAQTASYTGVLHDVFDTSTTASVNKVGMDIESTGAWTGTSALNTGLVVNATGGTTNYAATFNGGNVGIGTTGPSDILHIYGAGPSLRLQNTSGSTRTYQLNASTNGDLYFNDVGLGNAFLQTVAASPYDNVAIAPSGGYVGIGSASPVASLDLSQKTDAIALPVGSSGTRPASSINGMIRYNSATPGVEAYVNGSWTALLGGTGGVLGVANGGTGDGTLTQYSVLLGNGTGAIASVGPGSTSGQALISQGSSANPIFGTINLASTSIVTGTLPVGNGGTNASSASGTALDNITGFSSTGFLTRTGAGAYAFQSTTNGITLANLVQIGSNTIMGNATGATANVAALAMPSCSTSSSALLWTTSSGLSCNSSINAATLGGATFASPGSIGNTTAGSGTFTTLVANSFVPNSATVPANGIYLPAANKVGMATNSTLTEEWDGSGTLPNIVIGKQAAKATGDTTGFVYIPSVAGQPTGVPGTTYTGTSPIVADTTNNKIWLYNSGWQGIGGGVTSVSGDGTLITNSVSTGAVTLTIGSATAKSLWGNASGSLAAPSYQTSPVVSGSMTANTFVSTVGIGTAPFTVTSTTNVANLNASSLNGATFASPGAIGGTTAAAGTFTSLTDTGLTTAGVVTTSAGGLLSAPGALSTSYGGLGGNFGSSSGALSIASGTVTAGTLTVGNGGTGLTTFTAGTIYKGNGTSALATSSLTDNGTTVNTTEYYTDTQLSIGTASTDGMVLANTTAATASVPQWSPRVHFDGRGWETGTGASQAVDMIEELQTPQSTSSTATGNLTWSGSVNGATPYTALMTLTTGGSLGIGTTAPAYALDVNGVIVQRPAAAANIGNYMQTNAALQSSTTNLNPGITVYESTSNAYGMDVGYNGTYRTRIFSPSASDIAFSTHPNGTLPTAQSSFTDNMVIRGTTGDVGINTTSPQVKLDLTGSVAAASIGTEDEFHITRLINSGVSYPQLAAFQLGTYTANSSSNGYGPSTRLDINLKAAANTTLTGDTNVMTLQSNGNVGIGTTSPADLLDINGGLGFTTTTTTVPTNGMYLPASSTLGWSVGGTEELSFNEGGPGVGALLKMISTNGAQIWFGGAAANASIIASGSNVQFQANKALEFQTNLNGSTSPVITFTTPNTSGASTPGGNITLTAGNATGSGASSNGGSIILTPGTSTNGSAGGVGIGSTSPVASLDLSQKTDAIALPVGSSGTRPASSINGMIRYNSATPGVEAYVNGSWTSLGAGGGGTITLGTTLTALNPQKSGDSTTGLYSDATGTVEVAAGGTKSLSISSSIISMPVGSVGIGTTGPSAPLQVYGNQTITYTGGDTTYPLLIDASGSSISANAAFKVIIPTTGGQKAFQLINSGSTNGWASFEFNIGGTALPGLALGNGTTTRDTLIYRNGTSQLRTNSTFLVDGSVGIGTTAPQSTLSVSGGVAIGTTYAGTNAAASNNLIVQGNVGISSTSPGEPLDVVGNIRAWDGADNNNGLTILGNDTTFSMITGFRKAVFGSGSLTSESSPAIVINGAGTSITMRSNGLMAWTNNSSNGDTTLDTGISRYAADVLAAGNGTQGDYSGTLIASNVGVGVTSPSAPLHVYNGTAQTVFTGTAEPQLLIQSATSNGDYSALGFESSAGVPGAKIAYEQTSNGGFMFFGTTNNYGAGISNTALTIDYSGNVGIGIGTAAASSALQVNGTVTATSFSGSGASLTGLSYSGLPALSANQVLGALTATTPSGLTMPSCTGATDALEWTSGTGFACNSSINAASLGGATFASPGAIGGTTAASGKFTTLTDQALTTAGVVTTSAAGVLSSPGTLSTSYGGLGGNFGSSSGALSIASGTVTAGTLSLANGGTNATTAAAALSNVLGNPAAGTYAVNCSSSSSCTTTAGVSLSAANTWTGQQSFTGSSSTIAAVLTNAAEPATVSATAATGTINFYLASQSVLYYTTAASANWTVNFALSSGTTMNSALAVGQAITAVFLVTQGTTAYYNSAVDIDGTTTGVTTYWQNGISPTAGHPSSIDVYQYTIIKTASTPTYTVLASMVQY